MRKLYILFFLLSLCLGAFSQEITVRFTGQLNGTSYCRLDSVAVTNLTRNWTETIEYPDTIIVLGGIVGTNLNIAATQGLGQNIPNPFDCETRVELSVSQRENVRMQLLDVSGKQYADYRGSLDAGVHTFDISAAAPQSYILNAVVGNRSYSIRVVNMGSGCGSSIKYAGISGSITAKLTTTNDFQNGDNMRYVGYMTIYGDIVASTAVEQTQTASEDITLDFAHCINTFDTDIQSACDSYTWIDGVTYTESTTEPTFTLTNAAGCDSVVTLHLTINQSLAELVEVTACDSYEWNNETYNVSGDYQQTFVAANGCDSVVTLHLTINRSNTGIDEQTACDSYTWIDGVTYTESTNEPTFTLTNAEGCDSVVTLHLTINHSNTGIDEQTACDSYTWLDGVTYTESTTEPTFTLTNAVGCDSVVTLHLTINHSNTGIDTQTACDFYTWLDGVTYTESTNEPTFTLTNAAGCDSVVTLHLTINHSNIGIDTQTACDFYTWLDGVTYTESTNEPTFTLTNVEGCDSVVTLHLIINRNTGIDTQSACDSYTWIDGVTYTESTTEPTYTLTNVAGCDSVVTLHLTINHSNTGIYEHTACDSYTWIDGVTYTESTTEPTYTFTNVTGCDSVVTLHLTINHSNTGIDTQIACDNYTWIDGVTYTENTTEPTYTLTNAAGCDSIVTLHLTINHNNTGIDTQTACDSYTWIDGNTYTASTIEPTYTLTNAAGCDSVVTLHLTINHSNIGIDEQTACDSYTWIDGMSYTESTTEPTFTLTNASGCDSIVTLHLTINRNTGIDNHIACDSYEWIDGVTYTESTTEPTFIMTNAAGCDSIVTLHLTMVCPPIVQTNNAAYITTTDATISGEVISNGGASITARGFLYGTDPNNLTQTVQSGSGLGSFTKTITGLSPSTIYYYRAYATNSEYTGYGDLMFFTTERATTGTLNGHDWVDLGLLSGTKWSTCNMGASTPTDYGSYYAWGEINTKAKYISSNYSYTNNPTTLPSSADAATANWGSRWRMPTKAEFEELINNCTVTWTTQNGVSGRLFTGPNGNSIFLSAAGCRSNILQYNGTYGLYWSSSLYSNTSDAYHINFTSSSCRIDHSERSIGLSVRPVIPIDIVVTTGSASNINSTYANLSGSITYNDGAIITDCGFCYGTNSNNLTQIVRSNNCTTNFIANITGIRASTTYYYRAYVTTEEGTAYGEVMSFRTAEATIPTVITGASSDITQTSAIIRGNVTSDGGATVTRRGFYWGTSASSFSNMRTIGSGVGSFDLNITGLTGNTTYYYKAYATNSKGTAYGEVLSFTTMAATIPTVTTGTANRISAERATINGNVTSNGGETLTECGFIYGTSANDMSQSVLARDGINVNLTANITGLAPTTTYYYKAYATNSVGTAYGEVRSFTTEATTGSSNGHDWVDLGLPSGYRWATCNIGANSPEEYGDYFAWGETETKDVFEWNTYKYYDTESSSLTKYKTVSGGQLLDAMDDAATVNWGNSWEMPSRSIVLELINNCTYEWTNQNGVDGGLFTGPNGNSIFLPAAGYRHTSYYSSHNYYWSKTLGGDGSFVREGDHLTFYGVTCNMSGSVYRYWGCPVRPVCKPVSN
ncbi:MAG: hypothetical protein IKO34_07375 [Bacteroidales bacterium]|nr:hypothetical protein [Bacteroidales bacterium]